jgi:hypothetical protein
MQTEQIIATPAVDISQDEPTSVFFSHGKAVISSIDLADLLFMEHEELVEILETSLTSEFLVWRLAPNCNVYCVPPMAVCALLEGLDVPRSCVETACSVLRDLLLAEHRDDHVDS